ncbi:hypothetical protein COOONC_16950 [Cooperia oncophora]
MTRNDIGPHASFGGGYGPLVGETRSESSKDRKMCEKVRTLRKQSVVLVHGLAGSAGTLDVQRQHLLAAVFSSPYKETSAVDLVESFVPDSNRSTKRKRQTPAPAPVAHVGLSL